VLNQKMVGMMVNHSTRNGAHVLHQFG
jgi:hypothetical protein